MPASNSVDRVFEPRSGQTNDYKIGMCCFSAKHEVFNDLSGIAKPSQPLTLNIKNNNDLILKMDEASSCTGNITIIINIGIQDRSKYMYIMQNTL
jgi:hypothetical protein